MGAVARRGSSAARQDLEVFDTGYSALVEEANGESERWTAWRPYDGGGHRCRRSDGADRAAG
jgi:hypothetical protein